MNNRGQRTVLFVDDEAPLLNGLRKALRPFRDRWQVETALGGKEALALLDRSTFDAVVTDARMPDVNGEQVLHHARRCQPNAIRVVLSGEVDAKTGHRLASLAHQFIAKPIPGAGVIAAIETSCQVRDALADPTLAQAIISMGTPPLSPKTYARLNALLESPSSSADEVASLVAENVSLSTMLLRLVSSAYFGLGRAVSNVQEAVTLLGLETIREIVLLMEVLPEADSVGVFEEVQTRGVFRSRLARLVTKQGTGNSLAAEAALLAEVGVYVLAMRMPEQYGPIYERARNERLPLVTLERDTLGFTHDQVGASLLTLWNLPSVVVTAVAAGHAIPPLHAGPDPTTIQAFTLMLEEEALGTTPPGGRELLARIAHQLGQAHRLPELRAWAATHWKQTNLRTPQ